MLSKEETDIGLITITAIFVLMALFLVFVFKAVIELLEEAISGLLTLAVVGVVCIVLISIGTVLL